jgi:hypothetical protein
MDKLEFNKWIGEVVNKLAISAGDFVLELATKAFTCIRMKKPIAIPKSLNKCWKC